MKRGRLMSEWIRVKDKPVPKDCKVLAINQNGDQAVVYYELTGKNLVRGGWFSGCEFGCGGDDYFDNITHWMPLPEAPKN